MSGTFHLNPATREFVSPPDLIVLSERTLARAGDDRAIVERWALAAHDAARPGEPTCLDVADRDGEVVPLRVWAGGSVRVELQTEREELLAALAEESAQRHAWEVAESHWPDPASVDALLGDVWWWREHSDYEAMGSSDEEVLAFAQEAWGIVASDGIPSMAELRAAYAMVLSARGVRTDHDPVERLQRFRDDVDAAREDEAAARAALVGAELAQRALGADLLERAHREHRAADEARQRALREKFE